MNHILFQIFNIILNISQIKKDQKKTDNPSISICVNKIENETIFKIKAGYCL